MDTLLATTAVVCDDDAVLRAIVGQLLAESGYTVTGQAEGVEPALFEIEHGGADVVILDLDLSTGDGEDLLRVLDERHPTVKVVVFSAFVEDADQLLAAGATAVVDKPDFLRLEQVVRQIRTADLSVDERRRHVPRPLPALDSPTALTVSGLEPWSSFHHVVGQLRRGDALLAFDVAPPPPLVEVWDDVFRADYRLAVARAAATTRRTEDRVSLSPGGFPAMAVVGGHAAAPRAVFERVRELWAREVATATPLCVYTSLRAGDVGVDVLDAVLRAIAGHADPAQPLRVL